MAGSSRRQNGHKVVFRNNASVDVTFVSRSGDRIGVSFTLTPNGTKNERTDDIVHTHEEWVLKGPDGKLTNECVRSDELQQLKEVEVTKDFKLVKHPLRDTQATSKSWFKNTWFGGRDTLPQ